MNKFCISVLLNFIIIVSFAQGKLFIIGGGRRPPEMVKRLVGESGVDNGGYIVILPMASSEQDSAIFYAKKQFTNVGIKNVTGFICKKGEAIPESTIDSISKARLIYITGGDQSQFMEIVSGTKIESAIKMCYKIGHVIAGTSAGAAVMSEKMITGVELKYKNTTEDLERDGFQTIEKENVEIKTGLGFLKGCIIDQHFIKRKRENRLFAVALENPKTDCIGIDEATAILIKNNRAEVIGDSQVMVINNPGKVNKSDGKKLSGKNLKVDIYINRDKFGVK